MKSFLCALIIGAAVALPVRAQESDLPPATGNPATDRIEIEKYMQNAVEKQIETMRSSLPIEVNPGVVWQDIKMENQGLNYVYQIDLEKIFSALPENIRSQLDENKKALIADRMKQEFCPQIKATLCASLDLMNTFNPGLEQVSADYVKTNGEYFLKCNYAINECRVMMESYKQKSSAEK